MNSCSKAPLKLSVNGCMEKASSVCDSRATPCFAETAALSKFCMRRFIGYRLEIHHELLARMRAHSTAISFRERDRRIAVERFPSSLVDWGGQCFLRLYGSDSHLSRKFFHIQIHGVAPVTHYFPGKGTAALRRIARSYTKRPHNVENNRERYAVGASDSALAFVFARA